jgi:hypothetical protein
MSDDFQKGTQKTIDITVQATKITKDVLQDVLSEFMNGSVEKKGKITLRQLERKSQSKLESIEVTDNNIRDFLNTAKKYNVDFALKRDKSTSPPTYHVIFQTDKSDNFNRAFMEYAAKKGNQIEQQKAPYNRQKLKERAQEIAAQPRERNDKVRERTKENSL